MAKVADSIIKWSFYLLFFLVPLVFYAGSFELFEYNKMMLTYAFTIVIVAAWLVKLTTTYNLRPAAQRGPQDSAEGGILQPTTWLRSIHRTPLDIPILLYLASHILSTVFSLDPHVSIWGYYSRFHEGLLATISYILLYYAAVSNLEKKDVYRIIYSSFASGVIVAIWGVLEHFGGSPSCLFITGKFDDTCWVQDVKNRVFATLGQPNWMAAYLDVLLLSVLGLLLSDKSSSIFAAPAAEKPKTERLNSDDRQQRTDNWKFIILASLFFAGLLFTKSRSGLLGLLAGLAVLFAAIIYRSRKDLVQLVRQEVRPLLMLLASLTLLSFLFGLPFPQIEKFNLESLLNSKKPVPSPQLQAPSPYIDIGISESGDIRRIVWQGAIKVWQRYPILGSGVETFAYAYYKDRPAAHNMVSEWDFLYNKAHNEYLNILATTGTVGMLAYLSIIGVFSWWFVKTIVIAMSEATKQFPPMPEIASGSTSLRNDKLLIPALFAAYVSILVTNFFGFSVVIIGLFFFLIPAFSFLMFERSEKSDINRSQFSPAARTITTSSWIVTGLICLIGLIMEGNLLSMWQADKAFAYGKNLDGISQYLSAYQYLKQAASTNPDEPTFHDELSFNEATLASMLSDQLKTASVSGLASLSAEQKANIKIPQLDVSVNDLVKLAIADSNATIETSPNAMPFWKTRTKTFYTLAQIDRNYLLDSLKAIKTAADLAPTDAKVHYNYGILLGQAGQVSDAITILETTIALKPDYRDAHYALALYYNQLGQKDKAKAQMQFILSRIGPDPEAKKWLEENK